MEIVILFCLILFNGALAMAEIALVAARRGRLVRQAEAGDKAARLAVKLSEDPTAFLSTIQIGITAIGILNGIVGQAALAEPFSRQLQAWGMSASTSIGIATFLIVVTVTYLTIVVGELVPKRFAQLNAERIARLMAGPIALLSRITAPFVWLLSVSTNALLRLAGKNQGTKAKLTQEDIHSVLAEGSKSGAIAKHEHRMVKNVFRLDDRLVGSLMTPRSEIIYLDTEQSMDETLALLSASEHSRFPVCQGSLDNLQGVVTCKQLLHKALTEDLQHLLWDRQPCVYVPETLTGMQLLEQFRRSGAQLLFVVDEYGDLQGLVTLQDVLEALAGTIQQPAPEESWAVRRDDDSWLLDGLIPLPELIDVLELNNTPAEHRGGYHTLSGLLMYLFDRLPNTGDTIDWEGWRLEVVDLDGNRVDKVLARRNQPVTDFTTHTTDTPGE